MSLVERYLINCPFLGGSFQRSSTAVDFSETAFVNEKIDMFTLDRSALLKILSNFVYSPKGCLFMKMLLFSFTRENVPTVVYYFRVLYTTTVSKIITKFSSMHT